MANIDKPQIDREAWTAKITDSELKLSADTRAKLLAADDVLVEMILEIEESVAQGKTGGHGKFLQEALAKGLAASVDEFGRKFGFVQGYLDALEAKNGADLATRSRVEDTLGDKQ